MWHGRNTPSFLNVNHAVEALDQHAGRERIRLEQHFQQHEELVLQQQRDSFIYTSSSVSEATVRIRNHTNHLHAQPDGFLVLDAALGNRHHQLHSTFFVHHITVLFYSSHNEQFPTPCNQSKEQSAAFIAHSTISLTTQKQLLQRGHQTLRANIVHSLFYPSHRTKTTTRQTQVLENRHKGVHDVSRRLAQVDAQRDLIRHRVNCGLDHRKHSALNERGQLVSIGRVIH